MLFNSLEFLLFFPVITILYFLLPHSIRWFLLLAASCIFYMVYIPYYILILAFTITIDYFAGISIERASGTKRKLFLIFSLVANISILAWFKYFNFLNDNLILLGKLVHEPLGFRHLALLLPIGLSFHTFQAM